MALIIYSFCVFAVLASVSLVIMVVNARKIHPEHLNAEWHIEDDNAV
jgi:hypothetical protein